MKRSKMHLIMAILMLFLIYPAFLQNGLFGAFFAVLALVVNLLEYLEQ